MRLPGQPRDAEGRGLASHVACSSGRSGASSRRRAATGCCGLAAARLLLRRLAPGGDLLAGWMPVRPRRANALLSPAPATSRAAGTFYNPAKVMPRPSPGGPSPPIPERLDRRCRTAALPHPRGPASRRSAERPGHTDAHRHAPGQPRRSPGASVVAVGWATIVTRSGWPHGKGTPRRVAPRRACSGRGSLSRRRTLRHGLNRLTLQCFNERCGVASASRPLVVRPGKPPKPRLFVLLVGISRLPQRQRRRAGFKGFSSLEGIGTDLVDQRRLWERHGQGVALRLGQGRYPPGERRGGPRRRPRASGWRRLPGRP